MKRNRGDEEAQKIYHHLQPFSRKYLYSHEDFGLTPTSFDAGVWRYSDIRYVQTSILVAGFILMIACVNFMNLATARSAGRAREVGLRKVVGAYRRQLVSQFLGEAILFTGLALVFALMLVWAMLPMFNNLVDRSLQLDLVNKGGTWLGLLGIVVLTGAVSGSYPAVFLSSFQPATVLKGSQKSSARGSWMRKGLVVCQFGISIFLLATTFVVHNQLHYVQTKDLGFNREQIVMLPIFWEARNDATHGTYGLDLKRRYNQVKQAFLQHPNVLEIGASRFYLQDYSAHFEFSPEGTIEPQRIRSFGIDEDFFSAYDIPFVAGRPFARSYVEIDERYRWRNNIEEYFILNESAVQSFGWTPEEALGKRISWVGRTQGQVIGVVRDFHIQSLHTEIEPVVFFADFRNMKILHAQVRGDDMQETLAFFETTWNRFLPNRPFTYEFLNEKLDRYYRSERRQGEVFQIFALMAIFVACLGLFGLAAFTAEQRTKEMGIRKVLGASESRLMLLLSGEFTRLVLLANILAWPMAYWAMERWLANFVYRIDLTLLPCALSGLLAFVIALATVSYQAWKTARSNPIEALRYE